MGSQHSKESVMSIQIPPEQHFSHSKTPSRRTPSVRQFPPSESDLIKATANSLAVCLFLHILY